MGCVTYFEDVKALPQERVHGNVDIFDISTFKEGTFCSPSIQTNAFRLFKLNLYTAPFTPTRSFSKEGDRRRQKDYTHTYTTQTQYIDLVS